MRRIALLAALCAISALVAVAAPVRAAVCDKTWDGGASGSWHTGTNWEGDTVPAPGSHVCIPGTATVTHSSGTTEVATIDVTGQLILSGGTLTLAEASTAVTMTQTSGTLNGAGNLAVSSAYTWSGGTISGSGTLSIAAAATMTINEFVSLDDSRVLEVAGLVQIVADRGISSFSASTSSVHVLATGELKHTTSAGTAFVNALVENDGVVEAETGTLELRKGGAASSGDFTGAVRLTNGTFTLAGAEFLGGVEIAGATVDGSATTSGANSMTAGILTGEWTVGGDFLWSGGTWQGDGESDVTGTVTIDDFVSLDDSRVVSVGGTLALTADRGISSFSVSTSTVHIEPGGLLERTTTTGTAFINAGVENDGVIEAPAGTLELRKGGASSSGDYGLTGQAGSIRLTNGTFTFDGADFLGGVELAGATVDGTVTTTGANSMTAGILTGDWTVGGDFLWSGGTWQGDGDSDVTGTVTIDDFVSLDGARSVNVSGALVLAADRGISSFSVSTSVVHVLAGGELGRTTTTGTAFINAGVENDGTVEVDAGTLELRKGGASSSGDYSGAVVFDNGTFTLAGADLLGGVEVDGATIDGSATTSGANSMISGILTGSGTFTLGGDFLWSGGAWQGDGVMTVPVGATLTHDDFTTLQDSRTLEVLGTLEMVADRTISSFSTATSRVWVKAGGTLRKSGSTGTAALDVILVNDGTTTSASGRLDLRRGGTHTGLFSGTSATDRVVFDGGTHALGSAVTLDGWVEIEGGDVEVAGPLAVDDHLVQSGGTLGGGGTVTVTGEIVWHGGEQVGPGTTTVTAAGAIVVDGCSAALSDGRQLVNAGELRLLGELASFTADRGVIESTGRIELDDTGTAGCAATPGIYGNPLVHNTGTIEMVGTTGTGRVEGTFDNDGTVLSSAGTLELESTPAVTHTGSFANVILESGTFVLGAGSSFAGPVTLDLATLEIQPGVTLPVGVFNLDGGEVTGGGRLLVSGTLDGDGGTFTGPGETVIEPGATATFDNFTGLSENYRFVNRGTATIGPGFMSLFDGVTFLNAGQLEMAPGSEVLGSGFFAFGALLHNTGTVRKTGVGDAEISAAIDNDGEIEVAAGSLGLTELLNYSFNSDALVGGSYVMRPSTTLRVPGIVTRIAARVVLDGADSYLATGSPPNVADALALERIAGAGDFSLEGGRSLTAADGLRMDGALRIGPGSTLSVTGPYVQTGRLFARVTAAEPARVAASGAATLGGALAVDSTGFSPPAGTQVPILTHASATGTFATVTGTAGYDLVYAQDGTRLVRQAARPDTPEVVDVPPPPERVAPLRIDARDMAGSPRSLRVRVAAARGLTLGARVCSRCGVVEVRWRGRVLRRVSLRAARSRVRRIPVATWRAPHSATVTLRTRSGRPSVRYLLVAR